MNNNDNVLPSIQNNVEKLNIGELITYKDLCELLEQPYYKGGNQKKSQLIEFARYFDFENKDRKLLIKEIYDKPKEKEYRYPANAIYAECIEKILLTYLSKQKGYITYISSQYLYWTLGMVNKDYIDMQRPDNKEKLRQDLRNKYEWDKETVKDKSVNFYINDFYSRCRSKFADIIDSSLKSLQRRRLIEYSNVYHMYFEESDLDGTIIRTYDKYSDDAETKDIMTIEREVLDLYGFENESEVYLHHVSKEYHELITEKVRELYPGLKGIYRCFKFLFDKNNIKNALSRDEENRKKKELNDKVLNFINEQTNKNYLSTIDVQYGDGQFKYTRNYEQAQYYLSDRLIKIK
jgi:hypothetical protein